MDPTAASQQLPNRLKHARSVERRLLLELGPAGPWQASVTVTAIQTNHGRQSTIPQDWVFEVGVKWTGPPAAGMPATTGPVASRDAYALPNQEDAIALARKAFEHYRNPGQEPADLRELAGVTQPKG